MDTIIPESTEQEVSVEQENATFFVLGDAAYTSEIIEEYNRNAENKTNEFNSNSDAKVKEYNTNATNKTTAFNSNYDTKVADFNKNAETQTETFNSNATTQVNSFNANATTSIQNYNANAEQKLYEFNANALSYEEGITDNSNRVKRLETDIFDSGEASGTSINIKDSTLAEFQEISVDGVCEQVTTTGKQLFNINTITKEHFIDELGNILSNTSWNISLENIEVSANEEYTFSRNKLEINESQFIICEYKSNGDFIKKNQLWQNGTYKYTITTTSETKFVHLGYRNDFAHSDLMFQKGADRTQFEPYTGGQPSPSPDYPQEIKTIENSLKIRSNNFNYIFGVDIKETLIENTVLRSVNNGIINIKKTTTEKGCNVGTYVKPISVKAGDKINLEILNGTINGDFSCQILDKNYGELGVYISSKEENLIKSDGIVEIIMPYIPETTTFEDVDFVFALNVEESLETQITANLPEGEFAGKIDDTYKDQFRINYNEEDGKYHLLLNKMVGKKVLNGTEKLIFVDREVVKVFIYEGLINKIYKSSTNENIISTHYKSVKDIESNIPNSIRSNNNGQIFITIENTNPISESVEAFKTWLSSNNVSLYYRLAEPYEVDLGVVNIPLSYSPETNVFTTHELQTLINAMYYRDIKNTITTMQTDIETLKEAVATLTANQTNLASEVDLLQEQTETESEVIE